MTSAAEIVSTRSGATVAPQGMEAFLRENPWPAEPLSWGRPLDFLWHFDLDVTAAELWPFVMDTSHFNRAMGTSKMDFREVDGVLHGSTRNAGVLQEWTE